MAERVFKEQYAKIWTWRQVSPHKFRAHPYMVCCHTQKKYLSSLVLCFFQVSSGGRMTWVRNDVKTRLCWAAAGFRTGRGSRSRRMPERSFSSSFTSFPLSGVVEIHEAVLFLTLYHLTIPITCSFVTFFRFSCKSVSSFFDSATCLINLLVSIMFLPISLMHSIFWGRGFGHRLGPNLVLHGWLSW